MRTLTFWQLNSRAKRLGYEIVRNKVDCLGRKQRYARVPSHGSNGGATVYYDKLSQIAFNLAEIEKIRRWQEGVKCPLEN